MSKNEGKLFEKDFEDSCKGTSHYFMRLVDSAKWVQGQGSLFTPSNKADSILHTMPFLWLLELKSTKGASVSFYADTPWEKPSVAKGNVMIKPNQVKDLMKAVETEGVIAGFIINFRERILKTKTVPSSTYFVHVKDFIKFAVQTGKSSISQDDCEMFGILIPQEKKRVRYKYDIQEFVDLAVVTYLKKGYICSDHLEKVYGWIGILLLLSGNDSCEVTA